VILGGPWASTRPLCLVLSPRKVVLHQLPGARKPRSLSLLEREKISRGLVEGRSFGQLGGHLGRVVSTIRREVARNGWHRAYRVVRADKRALDRTRRPKPCQLAFNLALNKLVAGKLPGQWSPQQIAWWLKAQYPGDPSMNVSHETIYKSLFSQARGVLKKELLAYLRSRGIKRRGGTTSTARQTRDRSSMPYRSATGPPTARIVSAPAIGKAIC
jgi:IS30 family transposase